MSKIVIAADIVPTKSNYELFIRGNRKVLIGEELEKVFNQADFIAMNLETPLCDELCPIQKAGPNLYAPIETINGLKAINPYFYTLANNHIMDQGTYGLQCTMRVLEKHGISYAGAGKNRKDASKPFIIEIDGISVGFYCCAEHEFSIAEEDNPGANPYDPLVSFDEIVEMKRNCEYLIVLYHGGKEHYRYPSPKLQQIFHKFADCGANLVVAQHTHCIGCYENYKDSCLVYGQGNFLFDNSESLFWKNALLVCIEFNMGKREIKFIPIEKDNNCVKQSIGDVAQKELSEFYERSKQILEKGFIENEYQRYARSMAKEYFVRLHGKQSRSLIVKVLNKITNYRYIQNQYPEWSKAIVRNVLECEAHNELATMIMSLIDEEKEK